MKALAVKQLRLSDFDYSLPEYMIAQEPWPARDRSRLMVLERKTGAVKHMIFTDLERHLLPGDLLVLNDTKVYPCRLLAKKKGGGKAEIFLISERGPNWWNALIRGASGVGKRLFLEAGIEAEITDMSTDSTWMVRFHGVHDLREQLPDIGKIPLPPYIKRDSSDADRERYQTVYAVHDGAVAAPTAGLHFTHELLQKLALKGIESVTVTLHVGPGTFQPVRTDVINEHRMQAEKFLISEKSASSINKAKAEGRRIIAVGTTSVRTIETAAQGSDNVLPGEGTSELFIYPGYRFQMTDGMITNFHLPKSTLIMLVSAFAGRQHIFSAYRQAIAAKYRFYSYGDAMLII